MRLIDADDILARVPDNLPYKASVRRVLMQAEEVDAVPVVRCKDCEFSPIWGSCLDDPEGFCSHGKRKGSR